MMSKHVICQNLIIFFLSVICQYMLYLLCYLYFFLQLCVCVPCTVQNETSPIHVVDLKSLKITHFMYTRDDDDVLLRFIIFYFCEHLWHEEV